LQMQMLIEIASRLKYMPVVIASPSDVDFFEVVNFFE
jgi:hypothetical protein